MSNFLDELFRAQPASALVTTGGLVDVSASSPPSAGYILTAVDDEHALWLPPSAAVDSTARASAAAASAAAATAQTTANNAGPRNAVWDPPLTGASVDDEEFATDVFASGAWIAAADATPITTTLTRAGAIDPSTSPSAGTFRSSVAGSTVWVQGPAGTSCWFYKAMAGALTGTHRWLAGITYSTPFSTNVGGASDPYVSFMVCAAASGRPDKNLRFGLAFRSSAFRYESINVDSGGANFDASTADFQFGMSGFGLTHNHTTAQGGHRPFAFDQLGNVGVFPNRSLTAVSGVGYIAFLVSFTVSNTLGGSPPVGFHFVRRKVGASSFIYG